MDDLLQDFLAETGEHLEAAGAHLVQFERNPADTRDIASIFRLVHTIKGTCGFIGLPRLERLAHKAEGLVAQLRDGVPSTRETVSLVLETVDRIKLILAELAAHAVEPPGDDEDLIAALAAATGDNTEAREPLWAVEATAFSSPAIANGTEPNAPPVVERAGSAPPAPSQNKRYESVRVAVSLLESLMTLVSELVLTRNQLVETNRRGDEETTKVALGRLSNLVSDLQDTVMRARMQPLERLFASLTRLTRELGRELGKPIELLLAGADTELDRQLVEMVRDPLTHLLRNCADHGIEAPVERRAAGKPEFGTIRVTASHEAGTVAIRVEDDGRGLDLAKIRARALASGLATEAEIAGMGDADVCRFIFAPGFSTAAALTTVSGRGVGMDIVKRNIEGIGGAIELATVAGRGTTFTLKIPLTLAIAPALIVRVGGERFAVLQNGVTEIVGIGDVGPASLAHVGGAVLLRLRQDLLPVRDLGTMLALDRDAATPQPCFAVLLRVGRFRFGILVDEVIDTQEIVVKPLMATFAPPDVFSGNTILGDGSIVLILDAAGIARRIDARRSEERSVSALAPDVVSAGLPATPLILFRAGPGPCKAVPLSLVTRIEMVEAAAIVQVDERRATVHDGRMMPVIYAGEEDDVPAVPLWPVLIVGVSGEPMGIAVTEIVDIVAVPLNIDISSASPKLVGSTELQGRPVEILDITWFMKRARPEAFARGQNRRARVLLVEDKPFFRDLLAPAVNAAGYAVTIATGATGALAALRKGPAFDGVVTDVDMPGMSGYALTRALKEDPAFASLPVIGLASIVASSVHAAAAAAGMTAIIGKFDRGALIEALSKALHPEALGSFALERQILSEKAA